MSLTAIILTFNEELHLQRCIDSLKSVCSDIFIIDSFSNDNTKGIAELNEVHFYQKKWTNHSEQFNWGLDNLPLKTDWIIRLDADEYLTNDLKKEIIDKLEFIPISITGIVMPRTRIFLNKEIKWGGAEVKLIRIFRRGFARVENKLMDEHIEIISGNTINFNHKFVDHNLNNMYSWISKHNNYSDKEVIELLRIKFGRLKDRPNGVINIHAQKKRNLKARYSSFPLFLRSFFFFFYRYIFCLGFLDGKEGFLWHFFQGLWYRTLVDLKIFEIYLLYGNNKSQIKKHIKDVYKVDLFQD